MSEELLGHEAAEHVEEELNLPERVVGRVKAGSARDPKMVEVRLHCGREWYIRDFDVEGWTLHTVHYKGTYVEIDFKREEGDDDD